MIEDLKCPDCGGKMTARTNRSTQQKFWGCNTYPKCKGTRNTDGESKDEIDDDLPSSRARRNDRSRWRE